MTTNKINGVYCVSNALGGGMKNAERTKKETASLHGEISVFELNKPHVYEEFETWPDDIQREYLSKLCWTHGATQQKAADMLGVDLYTLQKLLKQYSVPWRDKAECAKHRNEMRKKWDAFLRGGTLIKDIIPEETKQQLKEMTSITCKEPPKQEEKQVILSNLEKELPVLFPAPPTTLTDINLIHISTIANAMYHIAHISDESLRNALAAEFACWIWTDDAEHLKEDMKNIRRRILRDVYPEGGKA